MPSSSSSSDERWRRDEQGPPRRGRPAIADLARDRGAGAVAATVVIPTLNGDVYLDEVLRAIAAQRFTGEVEVLVIDSGSTDRTLEIVRSHAGVRLHEIPPREFGHGRTRNLGARLAHGRVVAFLTQDAIPAHDRWLHELTSPLDDPAVGGVVGRQQARPGCFPALKYDIAATFRALGPDTATTLTSPDDRDAVGPAFERASFYSDVNAASRRDFLLDVLPYRDLPYSEDAAFGQDLIRGGHLKAYAGNALVIHSNDMTRREYRKRMFDETLALRRVGAAPGPFGPLARLARWGWGVLRDTPRIVRDPDFGAGTRLAWLFRNPAYHAAKWSGYARAMAADPADANAIARESLEAHRSVDPTRG